MPTKKNNARLVAIVLVIGAVIIFPTLSMGFGMMGPGPMSEGMWDSHMWGGGAMSGWMVLVGLVMQVLFLAVLAGGGYLSYQTIVEGEGDADQALEELRVAYARGELTDEEYEQRREVLERDAESR